MGSVPSELFDARYFIPAAVLTDNIIVHNFFMVISLLFSCY